MIDLILWGSTKADFRTFAIANGLLVDDGDGGYEQREGFTYSWWAGSGQMMRTPWVDDTPPTYVPGFVALCRIYADFFDTDRIPPDQELDDDGDPISEADRLEQWGRSRVVRYIKKNGTAGTALGIAYREIDGVRIFKPEHVLAKLDEWGVPGHEWLGSNQF